MKVLYSFFIVFYIFASVFGEEKLRVDRQCQIYHENGELFSDHEWNEEIKFDKINDDTPVGTTIKKFKTKDISYIHSYKVNGDNDYLAVTQKKNECEIRIGSKFYQYEEKEMDEVMSLEIKFTCQDLSYRTLKIAIPLRDINNHSPKFLNTKYEYKLAMPLPKGFDFGSIGHIIARDIDLTNRAIDFAIKGDNKYTKGLLITSLGRTEEDKKNYVAKLITLTTIDFEEDTTFILSATDSGEPSRTTEVNFTIIVDKADSLPRFAEPLYIANLTDLDYEKVNKVVLKFTNSKGITLDRGYTGRFNFSLTGVSEENKKHFKMSSSGSNVQIELSNLSESFLNQGVISAALTASKDIIQARTAILFLLPEIAYNNTVTEKTTIKPQESKPTEDDSVNGYMVATIILALTSVGLLGYVIYAHYYIIS